MSATGQAATTTVARATITPEGQTPLNCYFNPTEYSIAKTNAWEPPEVNGNSAPKMKFTSGKPRTLDLTLLFDGTLPPKTGKPMPVGEACKVLMDAMEVPKTAKPGTPKAEPPLFTFKWGPLVFKGACTSLTITYKLFTPDGQPIRADVKLSLTEDVQATKGQNPTTRAQGGFAVHRVKDGDTLPSISYETYGDATKWRRIAEANGVDNPLHLRRGRPLSLPGVDGS
jgi:nucleoid-associated protein YgaU